MISSHPYPFSRDRGVRIDIAIVLVVVWTGVTDSPERVYSPSILEKTLPLALD